MIEFELWGIVGRFALGRFFIPGKSLINAELETQLQRQLNEEIARGDRKQLGALGLARTLLLESGATVAGAETPPDRA